MSDFESFLVGIMIGGMLGIIGFFLYQWISHKAVVHMMKKDAEGGRKEWIVWIIIIILLIISCIIMVKNRVLFWNMFRNMWDMFCNTIINLFHS